MFVRIKDRGVETTYDCRKVSWIPKKADEDPDLIHASLILDVGEQTEREFVIKCVPGVEYILMNDNGKTIDRKIW